MRKPGRYAALLACVIALVVIAGGDVWARVYPIETWEDLAGINLSWEYILMNDLGPDDPGYDDYASALANDGAGWLPIGTSAAPFTGTFDGGGHTISGLFIDRDDMDCVGLFGVIDFDGKVKNLVLKDVEITGKIFAGALCGGHFSTRTIRNVSVVGGIVRGEDNVGGLVGGSGGTILNSSSTADVEGEASVGGLVGNNTGTVSDSYSEGSVEGPFWVGGLVGYNLGGITNSYATGDVEGGESVGGFVGYNSGVETVTNSYSTGGVTGNFNNNRVGGFVGFNDGGTVSNSYSTGAPVNAGAGGAGGFCGENGGTITDSFWDMATSGQTESSGGTGRTTAQMKTKSTFTDAGWSIQTSGTNLNDGYPFLSWQLGNSSTWYIYEASDPAPDPSPRPRPSPAPEPEGPNPPRGFGVQPGYGLILSNHVEWGPGESEGAAQYNLYVSTGGGEGSLASQETGDLKFWLLGEFFPDTFEYTHTGLTRSVKYYYALTSIDAEGRESLMTSEILWAVAGTDEWGILPAIAWGPERVIDAPEADDSSGCFIATAAYGSPMSSEVVSLRAVRDGFLLGSGAGNGLVRAYYAASPVFAEVMEGSTVLRLIARLHLAPFVKAAGWMFS